MKKRILNITKKKQLTGYVVKSAIDKTVIVRVDNKKPHPIYKKYVNRSKKYYAHDPNNECSIGDIVSIIECRPISKLKRWRLEKIEKNVIAI